MPASASPPQVRSSRRFHRPRRCHRKPGNLDYGDVLPVDDEAQTFGAVGIDSCDEVEHQEIPVPEAVPEPGNTTIAALVALSAVAARRKRARPTERMTRS